MFKGSLGHIMVIIFLRGFAVMIISGGMLMNAYATPEKGGEEAGRPPTEEEISVLTPAMHFTFIMPYLLDTSIYSHALEMIEAIKLRTGDDPLIIPDYHYNYNNPSQTMRTMADIAILTAKFFSPEREIRGVYTDGQGQNSSILSNDQWMREHNYFLLHEQGPGGRFYNLARINPVNPALLQVEQTYPQAFSFVTTAFQFGAMRSNNRGYIAVAEPKPLTYVNPMGEVFMKAPLFDDYRTEYFPLVGNELPRLFALVDRWIDSNSPEERRRLSGFFRQLMPGLAWRLGGIDDPNALFVILKDIPRE